MAANLLLSVFLHHKFYILEESQRQKKIGALLQRDLVDVLQGAAREGGMQGVIISVSKVSVTVDLSIAKVYLSIFPNDKGKELLVGIRSNAPLIRHEMAQRERMKSLFVVDIALEFI